MLTVDIFRQRSILEVHRLVVATPENTMVPISMLRYVLDRLVEHEDSIAELMHKAEDRESGWGDGEDTEDAIAALEHKIAALTRRVTQIETTMNGGR